LYVCKLSRSTWNEEFELIEKVNIIDLPYIDTVSDSDQKGNRSGTRKIYFGGAAEDQCDDIVSLDARDKGMVVILIIENNTDVFQHKFIDSV
jgi:hypothetical protein